MTRTEHLLIVAAEEGSEVAHTACKALRFGLDHVWPEKNETNRRILEREIADILGVARELGLEIREGDIEAKRVKMRKMMSLSAALGTLESRNGCIDFGHKGPTDYLPGLGISKCRNCGEQVS